MASLDQALAIASPRLIHRPTPLLSSVIYLAIFTLWIVLFLRGLYLDDIFSWSAGILYVSYDTFLLCYVTWQTLPLRHRPPPRPFRPANRSRGSASLSMGVIIAAHNEADVLDVTLQALRAQSDPPDQILIADDGSSDATPDVLCKLYGLKTPALGEMSAASPDFPSVRWLRLPHGGKARALNAAILHLETDLVLTVDADTLLASDAIAIMRQAFVEEPELVAATGILTPVCDSSLKGRLFQWFQTYEYVRNFLSRYAWMQANGLLLISGAFAGFRRAPLLAVGGFDPECLVEDYEVIHRLHRWSVDHELGWTVRVLGKAHARTDAPGTFSTFLRQRRRWFAGFLQTQYWNRDMTGNARFGQLGTIMLPVKAVDTLQPIYGLIAFGLLIAATVTGHMNLAMSILSVIGGKIVIDLGFHLWSLHLYRCWTGDRQSTHVTHAVMAALIEPFSFQILRHLGATLGWVMLLTRNTSWGRQNRAGLLAAGKDNSSLPRPAA
jgi:cellulose synthase/poly-beta-1,6-N-acetylglucosamine synthase-like glycosyltransferase